MTDEEMAEEYVDRTRIVDENTRVGTDCISLVQDYEGNYIDIHERIKQAFLAGLKADRPKWHKVADRDLPKGEEYGKNSIHRKIYLKDRYGNLYTGNYYPKDDTHKEDCFSVEFLGWGFQGSQFCVKEQISEWCEISTFNKE